MLAPQLPRLHNIWIPLLKFSNKYLCRSVTYIIIDDFHNTAMNHKKFKAYKTMCAHRLRLMDMVDK